MLVDRWIAIAKMETAGVEGSARSSDQSDLDEGDMGEGISTTTRKSIHGLLPHLGSVEPRLHQGFQPRKSRPYANPMVLLSGQRSGAGGKAKRKTTMKRAIKS